MTINITEADLSWWRETIPTMDWQFAATYAESAPHEYVVAGKTPNFTRDDCERACRVIRTFGQPGKFFKYTRLYLDTDGWKYWDMANDDVSEAGLINRARVEHVYGVQNAPRTETDQITAYDPLATAWDEQLAATDSERAAIAEVVRQLGGFGGRRVLDIGCGTGLSLDLGITESVRYVGIDPSHAMLNQLVRKHPYLAGVQPMRFGAALERRVLGATQFDLVVALGGAGSYLDAEEFAAIRLHAKGPQLLTVYAEGESPAAADRTTSELQTARERLRELASGLGCDAIRIGRFDALVVS